MLIYHFLSVYFSVDFWEQSKSPIKTDKLPKRQQLQKSEANDVEKIMLATGEIERGRVSQNGT